MSHTCIGPGMSNSNGTMLGSRSLMYDRGSILELGISFDIFEPMEEKNSLNSFAI
jgi:hypothetical protein